MPVRAAGQSQQETMRRAVLRSQLAGIASVSITALQSAVAARDESGTIALLSKGVEKFARSLEARLPDILLKTLQLGGDAAGRVGVDAGHFRALRKKPTLKFDVTNPLAKQYAEERSAELVRDITGATRRAIREIMELAFEEQLPTVDTAKLLVKVIGLDQRRALAVKKVYDRKGIVAARKAADFQVRKRAVVIARTETLRASNEGQRQLWEQAIQKGLLPPNVQRRWVGTPDKRECPICEALDGDVAPVRGTFKGGLTGPPAHPLCRCAQELVPVPGRARAASFAGNAAYPGMREVAAAYAFWHGITPKKRKAA